MSLQRDARGVSGARIAPGEQVVLAVDHVDEESFGVLELCSLRPDPVELPLDHARSLGFTPVKDLPDVRQAHADALARPEDPQAVEVLLAVFAPAGRGAVGHDDTLVVPVSEYMHRHSETVSGFSDLHEAIVLA
ncbi:hypothetical protein GCM10023086_08250 [Streptomyces venetus]|uniref:Uncharacterized protein n=1 Tax=Streptomyces venetus TaxID=1701086 RepID=A0ABP8F577_9ACTN